MFSNPWILFFTLVATSWRVVNPQNVGIIVKPSRPISVTQEALYDPTGKKPTPTRLPAGVTILTQPLYGKGNVVSSQKKPPGNTGKFIQSPSSSQGFSQQQQRPHSSHLDIANIISHLIGGTSSQTPLAALGDLPSNADVNIQVVQPFYAHQRPSGFYYPPTSFQLGARPMGFQPQRTFASFGYSSFPRSAYVPAGNDQDEDGDAENSEMF